MKKQKGFTLIELLVVIAIIGILSAVVLTSLNAARQKARDSERVSDIKQIALAMELERDQITGGFTQSASMPTAIGTALLTVPTGTYTWMDNTSNSDHFCVHTTLEANTNFFVASEKNSGFKAAAPTSFADCVAD